MRKENFNSVILAVTLLLISLKISPADHPFNRNIKSGYKFGTSGRSIKGLSKNFQNFFQNSKMV